MAKKGEPKDEQRSEEENVEKGDEMPSGRVVIMPRGLYIQTKIFDQFLAKRRIASHIASKYVKDFDAVLLDAGSTAEMVAEEMFTRRRFLSVLTNNMGAYASYTRARARSGSDIDGSEGAVSEYSPEAPGALHGNELLITGGIYVDTYEALLGQGTIESIQRFTPNITIIGVSGLRREEGVFCHGADEAAVKSLLWTKLTDVRLIVTDWSKIGKRDAHAFGRLEELGVNANKAVVVTCNPPDDAEPSRLKDFEMQVKAMEKSNIVVERLDLEGE